jgi:hypothetical protein
MEIKFEAPELAIMLGKALGYIIGPDDMEIQLDPLAVIIKNIRIEDLAKTTSSNESKISTLVEVEKPQKSLAFSPMVSQVRRPLISEDIPPYSPDEIGEDNEL